MTVQEIFSKIGQRSIEGLMTHAQLADYFSFLGVKGYAKCHEYRFFDESASYRKTANYFSSHYHKLLTDEPFNNPNIIPKTWFQHVRSDVSPDTRGNHIKTGFEKWIEWEKGTKTFYEGMYQELMNMGEVAAAAYVAECLDEVSDELAAAMQYWLELVAIDYNMSDIIMEQDHLYKKYSKKLKEISYD